MSNKTAPEQAGFPDPPGTLQARQNSAGPRERSSCIGSRIMTVIFLLLPSLPMASVRRWRLLILKFDPGAIAVDDRGSMTIPCSPDGRRKGFFW